MFNDKTTKYQRLGKEEPMTLKGIILATIFFLTFVSLVAVASNLTNEVPTIDGVMYRNDAQQFNTYGN